MSGISSSLVGILYNSQLLRYAGDDGVAAYGIMMYVSMIFTGISMGYVSGSAPLVAYHYGANNHQELKNLLKKGITGIAFFGSSFFTALNNGLVAAILSFLRTFVFQVSCVTLLPLVWDIDGIWCSSAVAQGLGMLCTIVFLVGMRNKYHYA